MLEDGSDGGRVEDGLLGARGLQMSVEERGDLGLGERAQADADADALG